MNIQTTFEKFLDDNVNLNNGRVNRIKDAVRILTEFINNHSDFKDLYIETVPQGSYRQQTIIKPTGSDGTFDVDLLIILKDKDGWTPKLYLSKLAKAFNDSGRYTDLTDTQGKTRCVTIDYEGDFHVDLVPAVEREDKYYVCNKSTDAFEETDGDGYAQWFLQQDVNAAGLLVPIVRLLKFLRDSKGDFDTKSIILTTIAAMHVYPDDNFKNIPEALTLILNRINVYLAQFDVAPSISNPAMPGENFNHHWKNDGKGFNNLKQALGSYGTLADEASNNGDSDRALELWRELFGDKFCSDDINTDGKKNSALKSEAIFSGSRSFTPQNPYANGK